MIKRKAKPFKAVDFAKLAQKKYIDVNNALQKDSRCFAFLLLDFHSCKNMVLVHYS